MILLRTIIVRNRIINATFLDNNFSVNGARSHPTNAEPTISAKGRIASSTIRNIYFDGLYRFIWWEMIDLVVSRHREKPVHLSLFAPKYY